MLDAIAMGQVTPGPLFTTATFIGYLLGGVAGAAIATAAMFLPAFVLVALSGPLVPLIRKSPTAGAVLDGINAAALALMLVVSAQLARTAIVDWFTPSIAGLSAVFMFRYPCELRLACGWQRSRRRAAFLAAPASLLKSVTDACFGERLAISHHPSQLCCIQKHRFKKNPFAVQK